MNTIRIGSLFLLFMTPAALNFAGDRTSLRSIGMGHTAVSTTRGTDAIGVNPAGIAIPEIGQFNLSLINTSVRVSTELFSYDIYQKYFTGIDTGGTKRAPYPLTPEDKINIRNQLPENGMTKITVESMLAGISLQTAMLGGMGFAVIEHAGAQFAFSRDFFDLLYLQGLPSNAAYDFHGTSFEAWWYREYNFSYGRIIPIKIRFIKNFYAGVSLKLIRGYGIFQTVKNNSSLNNSVALSDTGMNRLIGNFDYQARRAGADFFNNDSIDHPFSIAPDPVGRGTGFDIGISAEYFNGLIVGVSITDIGRITWDRNILETVGGGLITFSGYTEAVKDSVKKVIRGENRPGGTFATNLPSVFRIGVAADSRKISFLKNIPGQLCLSAEYAQGLNESLGNSKKPRISLGAEYRIIPFLPLRTGLMAGGGDTFRWAIGFGLDFRFLTLDFASDNFGMFFSPKQFTAASFAMGLKVRV